MIPEGWNILIEPMFHKWRWIIRNGMVIEQGFADSRDDAWDAAQKAIDVADPKLPRIKP